MFAENPAVIRWPVSWLSFLLAAEGWEWRRWTSIAALVRLLAIAALQSNSTIPFGDTEGRLFSLSSYGEGTGFYQLENHRYKQSNVKYFWAAKKAKKAYSTTVVFCNEILG